MHFILNSTAFEEGQHIPLDYTADGLNVSPPLKWMNQPEGVRSFALICEDPDAPRGIFTHWLIFNIPTESRELSEGIRHNEGFANGTLQGSNDFGRIGYNGPSPPKQQSHRYIFRLFALNRTLTLTGGVRRAELLQAIQPHVLGEAILTGHYGRGEIHEIPSDPLVKKSLQDRESIHTLPLAE